MSFSSLGLFEPIVRAVDQKGYTAPVAIQIKAIPAVLAGRDVMGAAPTGTGKTASFILPLLQRLSCGSRSRGNYIRSLVLAPTRELAIQVAENVVIYSKYLSLKSAVVYGGVKINPQMMKLRGGADVLVATPGRLLDLYGKNCVNFSQVETLVVDEADKMLDMGFIGDIRKILALLPEKRQTLLFSATFSSGIRKLTDSLLVNPVKIEVGPRNSAAINIKQWLYEVDKKRKAALLSHLIRHNDWKQVLVFSGTRDGADRLAQRLARDGIAAAVIHGEKRQGERNRTLGAFKANEIRVLVATDIAARGIDISELPQVVNFDLPKIPENYIHRIGRTGRAGMQGQGISLVSADEVDLLAAIEILIGQTLVREVATGFVPTHNVPLTRQMKVGPKKPKKPKKQKQVQGIRGVGACQPGRKPGYGRNKPSRGPKSEDADKPEKVKGGRRYHRGRKGETERKKK